MKEILNIRHFQKDNYNYLQKRNLTDIHHAVKDPNVLRKETAPHDGQIWLLNAGIVVDNDAILYINSSDTSSLKIIADGKTAYLIHVLGSLKIDSVKVTSWNPNTNNYATTEDSDRNGRDVKVGTPRPYIVVEKGATGTTDITNSEIAYLGYLRSLVCPCTDKEKAVGWAPQWQP